MKINTPKKTMFRTLNMKMQVMFGGVFILTILGLGVGVYFSLARGFENTYKEELKQTTSLLVEITRTYLDASVRNYLIGKAETVKRLAEYEYNRYKSGKTTEQEAFNRVRDIILDPAFGKIGETGYLAGVSGKGILTIHPKTPGADASKHEFMQRAIAQKNGYLEYMWKNPGEPEERAKAGGMAYFEPWDLIIWASSYKSEFKNLINLNSLEDKLKQIKIGKRGYVFVLDTKGNVLIHPTLQGKNLFDEQDVTGKYFVREIIERKNGFISYRMRDEENKDNGLLNFAYFPELEIIIASKVYYGDMLGTLYAVRNVGLVAVLVVLVLSNFLVALLISKLTRPISRMREVVASVGTGDLRPRIEVTSEDEIGQMSATFNELISTMGDIIKRVQKAVADLFTAVQELSVSSQEITSTSNQQAAAVKEIVSTMEDSDQLSKSIAVRINEVSKVSNSTKNVVTKGYSRVQSIQKKMEEIQASNSDTLKGIKSLGEKIENIWDIVNIINGIADQTKIIAFNAELEAATAGEAGKNFQIVAAEIRRLADSTVSSTSEIKTKINEIQHSSDHLIIASEEGTSRIKEGAVISTELRQIFDDILSSSEISAKSAEQIATSINQQVSAFEQILLTLKQISEGIDNFVTSTKGTAKSSAALKEMAEGLQAIVEAYQV